MLKLTKDLLAMLLAGGKKKKRAVKTASIDIEGLVETHGEFDKDKR
eukprot:SAG22_NODE_1696_length_3792_cov_31.601137_3_plen_46_part_00